MKLRANLYELWSRVVKLDVQGNIYINGENNLYPYEIERVVLNSPTASRAASMLAKFIAGNGVVGDDPVVNKQQNLKVSDIVRAVADDFSIQGGAFIHVGYGIDGSGGKITPNKLTVLDYKKCRVQKTDDDDNKGKIVYNEYDKKGRVSHTSTIKKEKWFYPFNPDQDVIKAQIMADTKRGETLEQRIKNYRGQVYYVNLTPRFIYALSKFDSVYNDCDTEFRMGVYSNTVTREGFLGKIMVITNGLDDAEGIDIENDMQNWLGAEKASYLYHLDVEGVEDLKEVVRIEQIQSQYDDDMFQNTEKRIRRNILGAANNIPEPLISSSDGAMFGTSGDTYAEMKTFYNEQTAPERRIIEETLELLGFPVVIDDLIDEEPEKQEETEEEVDKTKENENGDTDN